MIDVARSSSESLCNIISKIDSETETNEEFSSDLDQLLEHYLLLVVFSIVEKCMTLENIRNSDNIRRAMQSVFSSAINATEKLKIDSVSTGDKIKAFHLVLNYKTSKPSGQMAVIMKDGDLKDKLDDLISNLNKLREDTKDISEKEKYINKSLKDWK